MEYTIPARGAVTLEGIAPGTYRLRMRLLRHKDWYIAGTRFGTADVRDSLITVTEAGNSPLVFTVLTRGGRITGRITRTGLSNFLTVSPPGEFVRPAPDGSFTIDGLAPGRYHVNLARTGPEGCATDHATVDVERGATSTVQLEACR